MKYFSRLGYWKNSTGSNKISLTDRAAYSYDWWKYLTKVNGLVIFNNTRYSSSTSKHQAECISLLGDTGKPDIVLNYTQQSLGGMETALRDEVFNRLLEMKSLQAKIDTKGTRKSTNEERAVKIREHREFINLLKMADIGL